MGEQLVMYLIGVVFLVMGWLLRNKDAAQSEQIKTLFRKHDAHSQDLQDFKLLIASKHYVKEELDSKFSKLEDAFKEGFHSLGVKIERLSDGLTEHYRKEGK